MRGGIYSYQKCPLCGSSFQYIVKSGGLICPNHANQRAHGEFVVQFGRQVKRRFTTFENAERFLIGLRYEVDRGTFDHRDYQSGNPLGFSTLAEQWLQIKKQEVKATSFENLERFMRSAINSWGQKNIKEIGFADIEDFLFSHSVSNKTKSNIRSCLHTFWKWLLHRQVLTLAQFPDFPVVKFNLGYRKIIDKETQFAILDEVYRISYHINPRIWLGIKWLCTYIAIRPGELLKMQEQDVNTRIGAFVVRHTKEGKEKIVPMLDSDRKLVNDFPVGLPNLLFFRHIKALSGCRPGQPFGGKYLYKWWKKACENLGVEGVDLYGGTRHSSATALKDRLSPEQIKAGTMHSTNKAFERYFQRNSQDAIEVYSLTDSGYERDTKRHPAKIVSYRK
jgi:integrase